MVLDLQAFFLDGFQLALREDTGSDKIIAKSVTTLGLDKECAIRGIGDVIAQEFSGLQDGLPLPCRLDAQINRALVGC